jgi:hypothetical protein
MRHRLGQMGLDKSSQAIHNSRLHLSSAFRTGNLLFASLFHVAARRRFGTLAGAAAVQALTTPGLLCLRMKPRPGLDAGVQVLWPRARASGQPAKLPMMASWGRGGSAAACTHLACWLLIL